MSGSMPGFGSAGDTSYGEGRERGGRRKKLAGYLKAANEVRQSYQQSYTEKWGGNNNYEDEDTEGIPGAFPDVAIVSHGDEQLILFPSYARRHTKDAPNPDSRGASDVEDGPGNAEYWAREWQKYEDDRAIVDIDVRGWIYSPHRGPMTRKNRLLIGLARQLSGIPAPKEPIRDDSPDSVPSLLARHQEHEAQREQEKIAAEAEEILRKGEGEGNVAARGGYSERPRNDSDTESLYGESIRSTPSQPQDNPPGPGHLAKRSSWNQPSDMTQAELATANSHLMARLKPFLTNPLVSIPITVFFYDEKTSVSRTVTTNEAGHFIMRAPLEFVPTHIRVLASEHLSATEEVKITEPKGVSVISDVDDTIKHSSIGSGAREIFRNTFIRDLGDLTIDGVKEWYNTLYDMGSYHLKQYSGMLQGIFEPVAERKKGTLEKIMRDFPERKFILVGDSGEADLEVYTDVVLANPGKIIAILIRDVTTPDNQGFFDSAMGPLSGDRQRGRAPPSRAGPEDSKTPRKSTSTPYDIPDRRPALPPRVASEATPQTSNGPRMGKLIDFDDEPAQTEVHASHRHVMPRSASTFEASKSPRRKSVPEPTTKAPPPRPSKPMALRGVSTTGDLSQSPIESKKTPPPPPKSRRSNPLIESPHPLSQSQSTTDLNAGYVSSARHKVSAAYNALPEVRSYIPGYQTPQTTTSSEKAPPPPPRRNATSTVGNITNNLSLNSAASEDETSSYQPPNKKLDLWKRRWKRAKDILDSKGVALRSWRVGSDICSETVQMVEKNLTELGVEGYGGAKGKGKTGEGGGEVKVKDLKS
ncbi:Phosphatidate phosphatase [Lachnellula occidentalis]|uniref:Phosphatidate phosphatase n=1 Tax=Lachnellula occidentalis TaxID=215460 RepID=A0A8H8S2A7_9HELO|nr:Phosphatidate phosphatase [Lachnellula occidentalis]